MSEFQPQPLPKNRTKLAHTLVEALGNGIKAATYLIASERPDIYSWEVTRGFDRIFANTEYRDGMPTDNQGARYFDQVFTPKGLAISQREPKHGSRMTTRYTRPPEAASLAYPIAQLVLHDEAELRKAFPLFFSYRSTSSTSGAATNFEILRFLAKRQSTVFTEKEIIDGLNRTVRVSGEPFATYRRVSLGLANLDFAGAITLETMRGGEGKPEKEYFPETHAHFEGLSSHTKNQRMLEAVCDVIRNSLGLIDITAASIAERIPEDIWRRYSSSHSLRREVQTQLNSLEAQRQLRHDSDTDAQTRISITPLGLKLSEMFVNPVIHLVNGEKNKDAALWNEAAKVSDKLEGYAKNSAHLEYPFTRTYRIKYQDLYPQQLLDSLRSIYNPETEEPVDIRDLGFAMLERNMPLDRETIVGMLKELDRNKDRKLRLFKDGRVYRVKPI